MCIGVVWGLHIMCGRFDVESKFVLSYYLHEHTQAVLGVCKTHHPISRLRHVPWLTLAAFCCWVYLCFSRNYVRCSTRRNVNIERTQILNTNIWLLDPQYTSHSVHSNRNTLQQSNWKIAHPVNTCAFVKVTSWWLIACEKPIFTFRKNLKCFYLYDYWNCWCSGWFVKSISKQITNTNTRNIPHVYLDYARTGEQTVTRYSVLRCV